MLDDDDFEKLRNHNWSCKHNKHTLYAYRCIHVNKKTITIWMHREILGIHDDKKLRADHIDHNGLNNQKKNLRIATHNQNNCYKKSAKNSTSEYLGVCFDKQTNRWRATITKNYKQIKIGRFDNEIDAALAYNEAAKTLHGAFANLNVIRKIKEAV